MTTGTAVTGSSRCPIRRSKQVQSVLLLALAIMAIPAASFADGALNVLHRFRETNPGQPSRVVQAADGRLFGIASSGGSFGFGALFIANTAGDFSVAHDFAGEAEGGSPTTLAIGQDGNLYGTTFIYSTPVCGAVFRMTPAGVFSIVHLLRSDEACFANTILRGSDGALYGTAWGDAYGAPVTFGIIFKISAGGDFSVLHRFDGV